jgi:uncharacterized protein with HEPN domain
MRLEWRKHLEDVRQAAARVEELTDGRTRDEYASNALLRSGVERQLTIIGEALVRLTKEAPDLASRLPDLRRIIAFRNVLVHGYDALDDDIVWDVSRTHVPALLADVSDLLAQEP